MTWINLPYGELGAGFAAVESSPFLVETLYGS